LIGSLSEVTDLNLGRNQLIDVGKQCKILLAEFFKLIGEDNSELGFQQHAQEDKVRLKTEARSTARTQTCTLREKCCSN